MTDLRKQSGWGERWTTSVEQLSTIWTKQMPRGKDYAAKGHVNKLDVKPGKITARVQGSRSKPYTTSLELQPHKEEDWERLIHGLAQEARWVADLLNGTMPPGIEERFNDENLALFPTRNSELMSNCNCPEKSRPCKHIAAVHYAFAEALDGDPFLLFELRGKDREGLIDAFHAAWFPDAAEDASEGLAEARDKSVPIMPLSADRFNRSSDDIPDIVIHLRPNEAKANLLQQLDVPPSWSLPIPPSEILSNVVEKASELAWEFALTNVDIDALEGEELAEALEAVEEDAEMDNPLFRALSATAPAQVESSVLPTSLPGAALLQGAIGVDLGAAEKNQARTIGKKKVEAAPPPTAQPVVLRRRAASKTTKAEPEVVTQPKAAKGAPAPTAAASSKGGSDGPVVAVRRRTVVAPAVEKSAVEEVKETKPVAAPVVTRRARTVVGAAPVRKQPIVYDTAARAAWEEGDAAKTWENALEAWKVEPSDARYQLLAAAADRMDGVVTHFKTLAEETENNARRGGRRVSTSEMLILLSAGCYDVATEFIMAMDDAAWLGEDPPGAVYLTFLLMALGADLSVPDNTSLSKIWDELFARGEKNFADSEDPPAPVGAWLDFALQDAPFDEALEDQYLQIARNLGMGLIEVARERPVALRPVAVANLAIAVAEALQLLADEADCDSYTAVASARAAADSTLARAVREAIRDSSLLGFGGGA